jgi:hypothetical protein
LGKIDPHRILLVIFSADVLLIQEFADFQPILLSDELDLWDFSSSDYEDFGYEILISDFIPGGFPKRWTADLVIFRTDSSEKNEVNRAYERGANIVMDRHDFEAISHLKLLLNSIVARRYRN